LPRQKTGSCGGKSCSCKSGGAEVSIAEETAPAAPAEDVVGHGQLQAGQRRFASGMLDRVFNILSLGRSA